MTTLLLNETKTAGEFPDPRVGGSSAGHTMVSVRSRVQVNYGKLKITGTREHEQSVLYVYRSIQVPSLEDHELDRVAESVELVGTPGEATRLAVTYADNWHAEARAAVRLFKKELP